MFATPAWQHSNTHRKEQPPAHYDLRDRLKQYDRDKASATPSPAAVEPGQSPTDAFFDQPTRFADPGSACRAPAAARPHKRHDSGGHRDEPREPRETPLSLSELTACASPLARELIDQLVSHSDSIYGAALARLTAIHKELASTLTETAAQDDRVMTLVTTASRKTIKPPAETRITDERTGDELRVGGRVAHAKDRFDALEAEVAALWAQWEAAQQQVDAVEAELARTRGHDGSAVGRPEALAGEMAKFEDELTGLLADFHEDARESEKHYSKKIKGVMAALLQRYLLED